MPRLVAGWHDCSGRSGRSGRLGLTLGERNHRDEGSTARRGSGLRSGPHRLRWHVQLRVRTADVDSGREHYCEVAAETVQAALSKLGW
ncbi:hypothetical protein GCM10009676_29680 [Prauserella halophila]|uniref:Uncharacterized protein n=1 Tax=Prauserella halophila TaxID=185641 RepID=A0ABN1WA07_9PSEU